VLVLSASLSMIVLSMPVCLCACAPVCPVPCVLCVLSVYRVCLCVSMSVCLCCLCVLSVMPVCLICYVSVAGAILFSNHRFLLLPLDRLGNPGSDKCDDN
jgi:hypothetical protein